MIPQFPKFEKLNIKHQKEVEKFVFIFDPYSDFNFTSLFCWDNGATELSLLHGNLVIKMADYMSDGPIFTLIGINNIDICLQKILEICDTISLVPEVVVNNIKLRDSLSIVEDRDQFDYIYNLNGQTMLEGGKFKIKRNKISKFLRNNVENLKLKKINFDSVNISKDIDTILKSWVIQKNQELSDFERETKAIKRLFEFSKFFKLVGLSAFIDNKLVGFSINEIVQKDYALCHFQKSLITFEHTDVFLTNIISNELRHFGCIYVNWEQDLGIQGLRTLKESYAPDFYLKKYTISRSI